MSAETAERLAAEEKARQDRASTERWARGTQVENKLQSRLARSPLKKDGTDPLGQRSVPSFDVVSGRPRG